MGVAEQLMRRRRRSLGSRSRRYRPAPRCPALELAPLLRERCCCGTSRAQGRPDLLLLTAPFPGLAACGGESHEHPSSWVLGMGHPAVVTSHCHRARLPRGQRCIPDPGQTHLCSELSWLPWQTRHPPLEGFGWLPGDQACTGLALLTVMSSSPKLCVLVWNCQELLSPPAPRAVPLGAAAGAKRSAGSRWGCQKCRQVTLDG